MAVSALQGFWIYESEHPSHDLMSSGYNDMPPVSQIEAYPIPRSPVASTKGRWAAFRAFNVIIGGVLATFNYFQAFRYYRWFWQTRHTRRLTQTPRTRALLWAFSIVVVGPLTLFFVIVPEFGLFIMPFVAQQVRDVLSLLLFTRC